MTFDLQADFTIEEPGIVGVMGPNGPGTTTLFDQAMLDELYPTNAAYVSAINQATDGAIAAGFLLEADGVLIKARAPDSGIGAPG